jgi:hypothetical protein
MEANRRNSLKSTGPKTEAGKQASRCNAVRHGLTAETVIGALEDAEDYKAFEAAITADYDAQSAVERELVLRLASLLWRLRRATTIETGLFEIQAERLSDFRKTRLVSPASREIVYALFNTNSDRQAGSGLENLIETNQAPGPASIKSHGVPDVELARCFLRLNQFSKIETRTPDEIIAQSTVLPAAPLRQAVLGLRALGSHFCPPFPQSRAQAQSHAQHRNVRPPPRVFHLALVEQVGKMVHVVFLDRAAPLGQAPLLQDRVEGRARRRRGTDRSGHAHPGSAERIAPSDSAFDRRHKVAIAWLIGIKRRSPFLDELKPVAIEQELLEPVCGAGP